MKILDVYFTQHNNSNGTACLIENLITNSVRLEIEGAVYLDEINSFINKAVDMLKPRYENVTPKIHWNLYTIEESDKNVITSE